MALKFTGVKDAVAGVVEVYRCEEHCFWWH